MVLKNNFINKIIIGTILIVLGFVICLYSTKPARSEVTIGGDVYSGGDLNNIKVENNSVVSANRDINIGGTNQRINGYNPKNAQLVDATTAGNIIKNLKKLNSQLVPGNNITGNFALNKNGFPEGTVWVVKGGLTVGDTKRDTKFEGKGTIIIENADLNISGNIGYSGKSSVGFIVKEGNINIKNNVTSMRGAYYTTGKITFEK